MSIQLLDRRAELTHCLQRWVEIDESDRREESSQHHETLRQSPAIFCHKRSHNEQAGSLNDNTFESTLDSAKSGEAGILMQDIDACESN